VVAADPVQTPVDAAPVPAVPSEPTAAPAKPASKPSTPPKAKPAASRPSTKPSEPTPVGPPVDVHFRLEEGIQAAELKIAGTTVKIDKRFQSRVPAGKHAVKWRVDGGEWKSGSVVLGTGHEWKIFVGPAAVRAVKL
jgi:hypothetical protein